MVVVRDVVDDEALELSSVPDDGAGHPSGLLEELAADRTDPALSERVRDGSPDGGLEDLEPFAPEDLVERVDELAAAISDERLCACEFVGVCDEQVPCGLGGPCSGGVRGDAGEEDLAGVHLDREQNVVMPQDRGIDGEEVAGDGGLGVKELGPGHLRSVRRRVDAGVGKDLPDSRLADRVAEGDKLAVDAAVSPRRVLVGETHDQLA